MKVTSGRALAAIPPGAGAAAMSAGIVSVALLPAGVEWLSLCWFVIGAAIWMLLVVVFLTRLVGDRARWITEADSPPALTGVASTCVLGERCVLYGWGGIGWAALAIAFAAWLVLVPTVLRCWGGRTVGGHFLLCVATQGLAVLSATLTVSASVPWLAVPSLAAFVLGLVFYVAVLSRFSFDQFRVGLGDQWVFTGALAISALAAGRLVPAVTVAVGAGGLHTTIQVTGVVLMCVVLAGYLALMVSEIRWPRTQFDIRRWSTAFPMGMTSAAALAVADSSDADWLRPVGVVLVWPAVVVCVVLLYASARRWARA